MKKVFVDIGAHVGEAFRHFSRIYMPDEYDFVLFEPNPDCYRVLCTQLGTRARLINKAVYTYDGFAPFYGNADAATDHVHAEDGFSVGCSLRKDHNDLHYVATQLRQVECVDILKVLEGLSKEYDEIVVKMDVEGAEYEILQRVKDSGLMNLVQKWYIEFHAQYTNSAELLDQHKQVHAMLVADRVNFEEWH